MNKKELSNEEFKQLAMDDLNAYCDKMKLIIKKQNQMILFKLPTPSGLNEYRSAEQWYGTFFHWLDLG